MLALVLAVGAFAQGRGMRFMGGGGDPTMLLNRSDVKKDLALTDDQTSKLDALQQKFMDQMRERRQGFTPGQPMDAEKMSAMRAERQKMQDERKKEINAILTADQQKRLFEIFIQLQGNRAILNPDVQNQLGLTDAQKAKIKSLQEGEMDAMRQLMEKRRNEELTQQDVRDKAKKNQQILIDELGKVLTEDQKSKLTALGGKPFAKDPDEEGGGGGVQAA